MLQGIAERISDSTEYEASANATLPLYIGLMRTFKGHRRTSHNRPRAVAKVAKIVLCEKGHVDMPSHPDHAETSLN